MRSIYLQCHLNVHRRMSTMKKAIFILLALALATFMTFPAVADQKGHKRTYKQPVRDRGDNHGDTRGYDNRDRGRDDDYRQPDHRPPGYRTQPRGRHYGDPHMKRGHAYHYDGHWDSYQNWEKYRQRYPARFRQGGYYRESGHLFFRFCDPVGASCFFFSIGR
jgi:hypothetical protein